MPCGTRSSRVTGKVVWPIRLFRFPVPAQPVDATPSNQLIRQYFPWRTDLFGCTRSKPSQGSVPADLTWRAILAFVFNARWVRAECCVDPLKPPRKPETDPLAGGLVPCPKCARPSELACAEMSGRPNRPQEHPG